MTPHQIVGLGVRLFAIWLLLSGIGNAIGLLSLRNHGAAVPIPPLLLALSTVALVCGILWAFPLAIAKGLLPKSSSQASDEPTFADWFSVGCSLIGVWALASAISTLASYLFVNYAGYRMFPNSFSVNPDWPLHIAYSVFQFLFGVWLLLGAKGLKKLLHWARSA